MTVAQEVIRDFLDQRSIAIVGVSRKGEGFGNAARKELAEKGYHLYLVHPEADMIGDQPCARSIADVADRVGGVLLVTPPAQTEKLVQEAIAAGVRRVWIQQGAESEEAIHACENAGIPVVHHECILMFAEPSAWFHRAHRFLRGAFGSLPAPEVPVEVEDDLHDLPSLEKKLLREVEAAKLPDIPEVVPMVTEADLERLPKAVQRYFAFMGAPGKPRDESFRLYMRGRFLFDREWVPCECAQYNSALSIARIFHMRLRVKGIVPTYVRDTYVRGQGRMLGKALDLVKVVDAATEEISIGECVTYLNDAVLFAPSMLLHPAVTFEDAGPDAFDVELADGGRTVRARAYLDARGAVTDFSTTDRFYAPPRSEVAPVRAEWRTPVEGWQPHEGRMLPTRAKAIWMLPEGPLPYAELEIDPLDLARNVPPRLPRG